MLHALGSFLQLMLEAPDDILCFAFNSSNPKFAGITSSGTLCTCVSESVAVLSLEVPDQSCGFANLQLAVCGAKLAICRAHVVGCQVEPRALLHALRYYAL